MLKIAKQLTPEQINQLADLTGEARRLCDAICKEMTDVDGFWIDADAEITYQRATRRMWRRLNALERLGHTEALW